MMYLQIFVSSCYYLIYKSELFDTFYVSDETSYTAKYKHLWSKHISSLTISEPQVPSVAAFVANQQRYNYASVSVVFMDFMEA